MKNEWKEKNAVLDKKITEIKKQRDKYMKEIFGCGDSRKKAPMIRTYSNGTEHLYSYDIPPIKYGGGSSIKKNYGLGPLGKSDVVAMELVNKYTLNVPVIEILNKYRDGLIRVAREYWDNKISEIWEEKRALYNDGYLKSEEWKIKREDAFSKHGRSCVLCFFRDATQIHHATYDRIFEECVDDLMPLCDQCHREQHPEKQLEPL